MALTRSLTEVKVPRRMAWRVMMPKTLAAGLGFVAGLGPRIGNRAVKATISLWLVRRFRFGLLSGRWPPQPISQFARIRWPP